MKTKATKTWPRIGDPNTGPLTGSWDSEIQVYTEPPSIGLLPYTIDQSLSAVAIDQCWHPDYNHVEWSEWRLCYEGGRRFVDHFITRFSKREKSSEFEARRRFATVPAFAAEAVNEVGNAIAQRMCDVSRSGGDKTYQIAVRGENGGVDRAGSSMTRFIASEIIPELLPMKRVGIYVDAPADTSTLNSGTTSGYIPAPYLYKYRSEDICNWYPDKGPLDMLLLRDHVPVFHPIYRIPVAHQCRYRLYYRIPPLVNAEYPEGGVGVVIFAADGKTVISNNVLRIPEIPFVMPRLSHSLMQNVSGHQIALLNLESTDISFLMKANYAIYVEQKTTTGPSHLKTQGDPNGDGSDSDQGNRISETDEVGIMHGKAYGKGLEKPGFISPPTGPLEASMAKQDRLKSDIRQLVLRAAADVKSVSAEAKAMDNLGLESGLSNIGLELQQAERQIASIWAMYMRTPSGIANIKYPDQYSLKTDAERLAESEAQLKLKKQIPSSTYQRFVNKKVVAITVGDRLPAAELEKINNEIDAAKTTTADPDQLRSDASVGLVSNATASEGIGYQKGEADKAKADKIDQLTQVALAQGVNPADRGVSNLSARGIDPSIDPTASSQEKQGKPKRGNSQQ